MARANPRRVLVAQLIGIAAGVAHTRRVDVDGRVREIAAELTAARMRIGTPAAVELLTEAAAYYATSAPNMDEWWHSEAFAFLIQAGADPEAARAVRAARRT
jgi:hypothetical protein